MCNWKILSNYRTNGLAFAVKVQERFYRRSIGVRPHLARRMALIQVRTVLAHSIDNGSFYHGN